MDFCLLTCLGTDASEAFRFVSGDREATLGVEVAPPFTEVAEDELLFKDVKVSSGDAGVIDETATEPVELVVLGFLNISLILLR